MHKHQKITIRQSQPAIQLRAISFLKFSQNQKGVTLIELMVALVIGLVVSLAVYSVLNASEGRKRTTTSLNDVDQAGTYAAYQLDKALRSSGSGFTGGLNPATSSATFAASYTFGCVIRAKKTGTALLPMASTFPPPFNSVPKTLGLAPVLILNGQGVRGDVIISMAGNSGLSQSITNLKTSPSTSSLSVTSTAGISAKDQVLLAAAKMNSSPDPGKDCLIDQIDKGFGQGAGKTYDASLGGDYHDTSYPINSFSSRAVLVNLGKAPIFNMFAVGANNTLFKYDLLQPAGGATDPNSNPSEFVDSVYQMEAIYGINDKSNFKWQPPTGDYSYEKLLDGSSPANARLQTISMVRVALLMRSNLQEKTDVSPGTINLFDNKLFDTSTDTKITVNIPDKRYRYRVIEATIPVRNTLSAMAK